MCVYIYKERERGDLDIDNREAMIDLEGNCVSHSFV